VLALDSSGSCHASHPKQCLQPDFDADLFSDANNQQRTVLIAFRNLYGDHTGAAQASVIINVLESYEITEKFHCFVGDNASSNDNETISALNEHADINLNSSHRIRCAGYIINLVVKATIYGKGVSKFEEQLAAATLMD
jgi:hypothetical protein